MVSNCMLTYYLFWTAVLIILGVAQYIRNRYLSKKKQTVRHGILFQMFMSLTVARWRTIQTTRLRVAKQPFGKKKSLGWQAQLKCSMLLNHITTPCLHSDLNSNMPTEREHSKYNDLGHDTSHYKSDPSTFRAPFLRYIDQFANRTGISILSWAYSIVIHVLAICFLISLL